ncbi:MAG: DUF4302 domain-containing protein [Muribaculaceae bacterium]|nr:DUF4302 domain-containing protein [Muribaculaceae bacterium]
MKKIFKITALLLLLPMVTTSCFKLEQDDIFDKSAAVRLDEAADNFAKVLLDKGGVWQMEYYANESMQGYVYVMKFHDNGTVDISGHNPYIGAVDKGDGSVDVRYGQATSQWDMITDNGPVLSFSSYNKYFHVFSRPDDILNTSNGTGNDGRGFEGDYEFTVLKYSGDTLYIQGKKYNIPMLMTRLPADTNDKEYLQTVVDNWSKYFNALIPRVFLTYPNGKRYVITDGSGLIMTLYAETSDDPDYDPLVNTFTRNGIIGHDAFGFMNPLEYEGFSVQHFVPQEDGSLLCTDDNTSTISAGDLAVDCFTDTLHYMRPKNQPKGGDSEENIAAAIEAIKAEKPGEATKRTTYWELSQSLSTGAVKAALDELNGQLPKRGSFKQVVSAVKFCYMGYPMQRYQVIVDIKISQSSTQSMKFYYKPVFTGENAMEFKYIESDGQTATMAYYDSETYSGLKHMIDAIMRSYKLSTPSMLAPARMNFTSVTNADDVMVLIVKHW